MYNRILVPVDGSKHAMNALEHAQSLAVQLAPGCHITLLHVNPSITINEPPIGIDLGGQVEAEGLQILQPAVKLLEDAGGISFDALAKTGHPASVICATADSGHYDLIVMGCRGMGLLSEMLLGSVSHEVIQHARCPVTIVK